MTLAPGAVILYANACLARMLKRPLDQVFGQVFTNFLAAPDRAALKALLKRAAGYGGGRLHVLLHSADGSRVPVQISVRPMRDNLSSAAAFGVVVTDMTESRRIQEVIQDLSHRLAQANETERDLVASRLSDDVAQSMVAIRILLMALAEKTAAHEASPREAILKLGSMLGDAAEKVERMSRDLRPIMLKHVGLVAAMATANQEFEKRTGLPVRLSAGRLDPPPMQTSMALYRIFEEALRNIEKHACARQVSVRLGRRGAFIELEIRDDGIGFHPARPSIHGKRFSGVGLLRMRERAEFLGGTLTIKAARPTGTEVKARIPVARAQLGGAAKASDLIRDAERPSGPREWRGAPARSTR
jgi:PAS domain S-box-containing protein